MASLYTGNYGMSQNCMDEGKEYFFVKLTDSAYRAIEEYQKNQNKFGQHATIQVIGNGGVLSFPNGDVGQKFSFSVDDVDGSIECIEQNQNQLDVLGSLPNKMRIHANEDVYDLTKQRMAVVQETQKDKCTREIKPNQTDIGRKVKVKATNSNSNSNNRPINPLPRRDHSSSRSPSTSGGGCNSISPIPSLGNNTVAPLMTSKSSINNLYNASMPPTTASSLSSALSSAAGSGTKGISNGFDAINSVDNVRKGVGSGPAITGGGNNSNIIRNQKIDNRHKPDITKRKIRERLIHLLALKPFKKPELYSRLSNEGIRDKEKNLISTILKEISTMRDNTYNLKRPIWNDVNENWPFYTEQEIQMLKRRKPQNLTPLSSDGGSSTSGQSPTSTHNGSPTPAVKRPTHDRDRDRSYYEDPMSKKQRISHFKKDSNVISANIMGSNKNHQESDESSVDLSYNVLDTEFLPTAEQLNKFGGVGGAAGAVGSQNKLRNVNNNNKSPYANNNNELVKKHQFQQQQQQQQQQLQQQKQQQQQKQLHQSPTTTISSSYHTTNNDSESSGFSSSSQTGDDYNNYHQQQSATHNQQRHRQQTSSPTIKGAMKNCNINSPTGNREINNTTPTPTTSSTKTNSHHTKHQQHQQQQQQQQLPHNFQSDFQSTSRNSSNINNHHHNHHNSPSASVASNLVAANHNAPTNSTVYDFSNFAKIESIEQRRLYKTEFERDFVEYRKLLTEIDSVTGRFRMLAQRLEKTSQDVEDYKNIRKQILSEYERIRGEEEYERTKMRFDYLHAKLAHIKGLVSEYDEILIATGADGTSNTDAPNTNDGKSEHNSDRNYFNLNNGIDGDDNYSSALSSTESHHLANGGNY